MIVKVSSRHQSGSHGTLEWRKQATGTIICPVCFRVDRRWYPRPIDVYLQELAQWPIVTGGYRTAVSMFHTDFIAQIRPYMKRFVFGRCFTNTGALIPEYLTAYCDLWIVTHSQNTKYFRCEHCGIRDSSVVGRAGYVLRTDLGGESVWANSSGQLFLAERLVNEIDWSQFPDVRFYRFKVLDKHPKGQGEPVWEGYAAARERGLQQHRGDWLEKFLGQNNGGK